MSFCVLFVCKCVLPPGDNPTAVNKYIESYLSNAPWIHLHVILLHLYLSPVNAVHLRYANYKLEILDSPLRTLKQPMFTHANTHNKTPLTTHCIYSGNKEICCIFKTCCMISVLFPTKFCLFHNFIFCSPNTFFMNHVPKFKHQPSRIEITNKMRPCSRIYYSKVS